MKYFQNTFFFFLPFFLQSLVLTGCIQVDSKQADIDEQKRWKSPGAMPYPKLPYPKFAFTATYECTPQEPLHGGSGATYRIKIIGDGKGHLVELDEQVKKDGKREFIRNCLEDWEKERWYQLVKDAATKKDIGWQSFALSPDVVPVVGIFEPAFKQHSRRFYGVHPEPLGKKMIDGKICRGWKGGDTEAWFDEKTGIEVESTSFVLRHLRDFTEKPVDQLSSNMFTVPTVIESVEKNKP